MNGLPSIMTYTTLRRGSLVLPLLFSGTISQARRIYALATILPMPAMADLQNAAIGMLHVGLLPEASWKWPGIK